MWDFVRWVGAGFVGAAVLLAFGSQAVVSQQPGPAPNGNIYINPLAGGGRFANPGALGPAGAASTAGRLGYGSGSPGTVPASGAGSLAASYANPNLGYGSLSNANNNPYGGGGYGMAGYGMYGTQWMMNPYQGYLSGAADVTRAQAEYWQTIQQAKLTRQEAIRSSIQTRRAMIEEAEWERAHMPDPEKIRQQALERELNRARSSPPLTDIWTARALNALLRHLIAQQGQGAKGPDVRISEDTLDHINLKIGDNRGNAGLLKDSGNLRWPLPLLRDSFKEGRESINRLMQAAYKSAAGGSKPDSGTIRDLQANYKKLKDELDANVSQLTPDEYIAANQYLNHVDRAISALKSPNVVHYFDGSWKSNARNVADLVKFMREQGLWFDEATPKDEPYYTSLYYALAAYDRGVQRVARDSGE